MSNATTRELQWERRPSDRGPDGYWSPDNRWAILPTPGERTWDLVEFVHDGVELIDVYDSVAQAKRRVERETAKEWLLP